MTDDELRDYEEELAEATDLFDAVEIGKELLAEVRRLRGELAKSEQWREDQAALIASLKYEVELMQGLH